jgi:hypothetical protein
MTLQGSDHVWGTPCARLGALPECGQYDYDSGVRPAEHLRWRFRFPIFASFFAFETTGFLIVEPGEHCAIDRLSEMGVPTLVILGNRMLLTFA